MKFLKRYLFDRSGNVAITFSIMGTLLVGLSGGVYDVARLHQDKARAQYIADATVLAAAAKFEKQLNSDESDKDITLGVSDNGVHVIDEDFEDKFNVFTTINYASSGTYEIKTMVATESKHAFLGMLGIDDTKFVAESVSEVAVRQLEIIFLIDVSSTMKAEKLDGVKAATIDFISGLDFSETEKSYTKVSLIPFAENVNMGKEAKLLLDDIDGHQYSKTFNGCFRHNDGRSYGELQALPDGTAFGNPDFPTYCPSNNSQALLFSSDRDELESAIENLERGWGRSTDVGVDWAERVLDPSWRQEFRWAERDLRKYSPYTKKFVILLTDNVPSRTDPDQNGKHWVQKKSNVIPGTTNAQGQFKQSCKSLGANDDVHIYTVSYGLDKSKVNEKLVELLQGCLSGNGQYFNADVDNVTSVFRNIRSSLHGVYLKR